MDFSKQISTPEIMFSSGFMIRTPNNGLNTQKNLLLIDNQKKHRELFAEFLRLISILLRMT